MEKLRGIYDATPKEGALARVRVMVRECTIFPNQQFWAVRVLFGSKTRLSRLKKLKHLKTFNNFRLQHLFETGSGGAIFHLLLSSSWTFKL